MTFASEEAINFKLESIKKGVLVFDVDPSNANGLTNIEVVPLETDKPEINGTDVVPSVIAIVTDAEPPELFFTARSATSKTSKFCATGSISAGVPESDSSFSDCG